MGSDANYFARILKRSMSEKGLKQKDLAAYFGVRPATVSMWLSPESYPERLIIPGPNHDMKIAEITGIDLATIKNWRLTIRMQDDFGDMVQLANSPYAPPKANYELSEGEEIVVRHLRAARFFEAIEYITGMAKKYRENKPEGE